MNRAIVELLELDGRMAFSEIANRLAVSEGTVRNRVAAMKESGHLRIVAVVDPTSGVYETDAMLGLKLAPGAVPADVAGRLGADARVVYILWVGGRYDLLAEVVTESHEALTHFLETEIHGRPDIASVETMIGLANFKNQFLLKAPFARPERKEER